jgi:hypothetical protein
MKMKAERKACLLFLVLVVGCVGSDTISIAGQCILIVCKSGCWSWFGSAEEENGCHNKWTLIYKLHSRLHWHPRLHILHRLTSLQHAILHIFCPDVVICSNLVMLFEFWSFFDAKFSEYFWMLSADSLTVESLLELLDEESLRKDTALPSPEWSSDHIALLAEFRCKPRPRR